jgi:hypothetical protein
MSCGKGTLSRPHPTKPFVYQYLMAKCHKLRCPDCGPKKASRYKQAAIAAARKHGLIRLVTLTLDPGLIPADENSLQYIQQVWSRFRTFLRDKRGLKLDYIRVVELHESGVAHFHLVIRQTIAQDNLRKWWQECGGGHQCTIGMPNRRDPAAYATKYISKRYMETLPPGTRVIATSQGIKLFAERVPTGWVYSPTSFFTCLCLTLGLSFTDAWMSVITDYFESESPPQKEEYARDNDTTPHWTDDDRKALHTRWKKTA